MRYITTICALAAVLLATFPAIAAPVPVDIDLPHWTPQSQQPEDGIARYQDGTFVLTRGGEGGNYMLRVFKDVAVTPGGVYLLTYSVKVEGKGSAVGMVFNGDEKGKWDEPGATYIGRMSECELTPVKAALVVPAGVVKLRLDLRAYGADTKVTYEDVALSKIDQQADLTVSPSDAAVTLDGKLDDPLWSGAVKLSPFRVLGDVEREGELSNEALLAMTDGYLYVGYRLQEPDVAGIQARKGETPDGLAPIGIYEDDCTETFLSTDRASFSHVIVNAAGARHWDQQDLVGASPTWYPTRVRGFAGEWDAKAAIGEGEWTCELRVRLSDLLGRDASGERKLYVNATRHRPRGEEPNLTWAPVTGQFYAVPKQFPLVTLKLPETVAQTAPSAVASSFSTRLSVPDMLMAGKPVKVVLDDATFPLPASVAMAPSDVGVDGGVLEALREALVAGQTGSATVELRSGEVCDSGALTVAERAALESPEAFRLELRGGKVSITGRSRDGVLRGIATVIMMASRARFAPGASLRAMTLYDAPRLPFRGLMMVISKRAVDVAFLLRVNKMLVPLDSFGGPTRFPFECYPIGGTRTTKAELVELFEYARARGIEPIPYFASWGRVQYLKVAPGMVDLLVDDEDVLQGGYRNLDVARPETHEVMLKLQEEIIETLHPESFCIAMDEAHFGHMVTSPAAKARGWKPSDWFAEALNVNAEFLRAKGVRMYIWGDMIDPGQNGRQMDMSGPELLARLPKDMAILDWKYDGSHEVTEDYPSIAMFTQAGLDTIGCPWFAPKAIPRLARSIAQHGGKGLLLTAWNDSSPEGMPPEWIRACALTAYYGWSPEDTDLQHFDFVPDAIMQGAAYWPRELRAAGETRPVTVSEGLLGGAELSELLGLPEGMDTGFLATPFANYRGVGFETFAKEGKRGAVAVKGRGAGGIRNGSFSRGMRDWTVETVSDDCVFSIEGGALKVSRVAGDAFRRVLQDFRIDETKEYVIRYRVKTTEPGTARVWTYSGSANFDWDEPKSVFSVGAERDWTVKEIALPPGYGAARLCFSVYGAGGTALFDDVELLEKGAEASPPAESTVIPVNAQARAITFLHTTSRQALRTDDMTTNRSTFGNLDVGEYVISYADGTSASLPLIYRLNIVAANDPNLGRETEVGLFGTLNNTAFVNIPTLTWVNPHPEKGIASVEVVPGQSSDMTLLVFGMTLE